MFTLIKLKVIEHGEGGATYTVVTGQVAGDRNHVTGGQLAGEKNQYLVSIVSKRMESNIEVAPRMTTSIRILTGDKNFQEGGQLRFFPFLSG